MNSNARPPYEETVLEFRTDPPFCIDLREPIGADTLDALQSIGLTSPFAIITASNPDGAVVDDAENLRRAAELEAEVESKGISFVRVDGCSPNRNHREPGIAICIFRNDARDLASRFGQDAIFWFDGEAFWLIPSSDPTGEVRLPIPPARWHAMRRRASELGRRTGEMGTRIAEFTAKALARGASDAWQAARGAVDVVRGTPQAVVGLFVKERAVPAFLLPIGSGPADYMSVIRFEDAITELESGLLVRPRLEVWAGREEIDRNALARTLRDDFTRQVREQREAARAQATDHYQQKLAEIEMQRKRAGRGVEGAIMLVSTWLLFMFFVANPLFDLIFLCLAVFGGADGITSALKYLRHSGRIMAAESEDEVAQKRLERDLDARADAFRSAVESLRIRVHPDLEQPVADFCNLDGRAHIPACERPDPAAMPEVQELLRSAEYREQLSAWFDPIVVGYLGG